MEETTEQVAVEALAPDLTPAEEARKREVEMVKGVLHQAKEKAITRALEDFAGIVEDATSEAEKPKPTRAPVEVAVTKPQQASMPRVIQDARDPLYARLSPLEREWRSPKIDEECARWIRAAMVHDHGTMREIALLQREWFERAPLDLDLPTGDSLIPLPLANVITLKRQDGSVLRPLVRRWTSPNTSLRVPISSTATAEMVAEKGANTGAAGPTPTEIQLDKKKMRWNSTATEEFLMDTPFNVVSWFTEAVGEAFGALEDTQICTSDGTGNNFSGNILEGVTEYTVASNGVLAYSDVVAMHHGVPKPYRARGVWLVSNAGLIALDTVADDQGMPIFRNFSAMPSVRGDAGGAPAPDGLVFSKPVYEVPLTAAAILFVDPTAYHLLDGGGMTLRADASVKFETDEVAFKAIQRADGKMGVPEAGVWTDLVAP